MYQLEVINNLCGKGEEMVSIFELKTKVAPHGALTMVKCIPTTLAQKKKIKTGPLEAQEKSPRLDIDM